MTPHRILVLVARGGNRQQLVEWIDEREDYDSVVPESVDGGALDQDVDCVVADGKAFERHREELHALVMSDEEIFMPTLLVSETAAPSALEQSLIDDVLVTPIRGEQLRLRLDNLLERRRQSAELADKARRLRGFRAAVEQAGHSIMITETDGEIRYVNPAFESTSGYEAEDVLGENPSILKSGEQREPFYADLWETILDGDVWEGEIVNENAHGDSYVENMTIAPIFDDNGAIDRFVSIATDVTERKEREQELERYREYLRQTRDIVTVLEPDGTVRYQSPAFERVLGWEPSKVRGKPIFDHVHPDDRDEVFDSFSSAIEEPDVTVTAEYRFEHEDGSWRWLESQSSNQLDNPAIEGVVVSSRDITERKEREREMQETKKTLESVIEASPNAIVMLDEEGSVVLWNNAATDIFGWKPEEVVNEPPPFLSNEGSGGLQTFMDRLDAGNRISGQERVRRTKSGEEIDVSLAAAAVEVETEIVGYMAVIEDVSDRKAYERRIENQRDTLELLNQVVRHDIRNDMQAVMGMAELLEGKVEEGAHEYLEGIQESGRHATDLTITARDLTRTMLEDEMDLEPVALAPVIQDEVTEAGASFETASVGIDGSVPDVRVEANDLLGSVFRNLLKNAVQHNQSEEPAVSVSATVSDGQAVVKVADNGPGIPDDRKEEIFGKGETGLDSEGTGVGLYLVQTLVDRYGGSVRVRDNDNGGSVFVVELSVVDE